MAANKLRTFLTMLGIVIGVGSVIVMLALGAGVEKSITAQISSFGANIIMIWPQSVRGAVRGAATSKLTLDDARALVRDAPDVMQSSPEVNSFGQVKYYNENTRSRICGVASSYFSARNSPVETGREFTSEDEALSARVAIVGGEIVDTLFSGLNPIGEQIKISGSNYTVVGILKRKGDTGMWNPDEIILVPITTAMSQIMGARDTVQSIAVSMRNGIDAEQAKEQISAVLRREHRLQYNQEDDFGMFNVAEAADQIKETASFFKLFLAGIASVSLIVGGIGIMNIMLVSVTERTREIGIRKALGAKTMNVLVQFLLEATTMSILGGVFGILGGAGIVYLFNYISAKNPAIGISASLQAWPIIASFLFALGVGVFFGWYPARKAAKMNPIDALRYE
ncbi:FtsX-like permease family protein [Candidatus Sumerlaeota bacterium]|nr:FtsX-like permease family protein [Candidatus Sumerlaeota bacterium]